MVNIVGWVFVEFFMRILLFILFVLSFLASCGRDEIDERNVCQSKQDCNDGYECVFKVNTDKDYGKCTKEESCKTNEDCSGRICDEQAKICVTNGTFRIESSILPDAEKNQEYQTFVEMSGVVEGHFFITPVDTLPEGLELSKEGKISGTPSKEGIFKFKVRLHSYGETDTIYYNRPYFEKILQITVTFNPCLTNPCADLTNSTCVKNEQTEKGYDCECNEGFAFYNDACVDIPCEPNPCTENNKTVCNNKDDYSGFDCVCDENYYLADNGECKLDKCVENPCTESHKTICQNDNTEIGYNCSCESDYYLNSNNECKFDYCKTTPCTTLNQTVCVNDSSIEAGYVCNCNSGYLFVNNVCVRDVCNPNPCLNSGIANKTTCIPLDDYTRYTCECTAPYVLSSNGSCVLPGDTCEFPISLDENVELEGDTTPFVNNYFATCGVGAASKDVVYTFTIEDTKLVTILMTGNVDTYNTLLHIRKTCDNSATELKCNNIVDGDISLAKIDKLKLDAGTYFVFADGFKDNNAGEYSILLTTENPCNTLDENTCGIGFYCNETTGACDVDKCLINNVEHNCGGNGICHKSSGICECDFGYILDTVNNTCIDSPCEPNPCTGANQRCQALDLEGNYECQCINNTIPTLDGSCVANPCSPTNTCTETNKKVCSYTIEESTIERTCSCNTNYFPDGNGNCVDVCNPNPCLNNGIANKTFCSFNSEGVTSCACALNYILQENGTCILATASACPGTEITLGQAINGTTVGFTNKETATCGSNAAGSDYVYKFTVSKPYKVTILLERVNDSVQDTVLHLRKKTTANETDSCKIEATEVACNDDYNGKLSSRISTEVQAGTYFIIADSASSSGTFKLSLNGEPSCTANSECTDDYKYCNIPTDSTYGYCTCVETYVLGGDNQCHQSCTTDDSCPSNLYQCLNNLCYKRTECSPACDENSFCNTDTLSCDCLYGFIKNSSDICVSDLCVENNTVCELNSTCEGISGECICNYGYVNYTEGFGCEDDLNPCTPNLCSQQNKNICVQTDEENYECLCNENYIENAQNECIANPCIPNRCGANTYCSVSSEFTADCQCNAGYYFDGNGICQPLPGNSCLNPDEIGLNQTITAGLTSDYTNDFALSCSGTNGVDNIYKLTLLSTTQLTIDLITTNINANIAILNSCSNPTELQCNSTQINTTLNAGTYYIVVDGETLSDLGDYQLIVTGIEGLRIDNNLKDAVLLRNYNESFIINGGVSPYSVQLTQNSVLPSGLTLVDGFITGIPETAGEYSFDIVVTDDENTSAIFTINLSIVDNSQPLTPKIGELVINEILPTPTGDINGDGIFNSSQDEFVEIINNSYKTLNLNGLKLWDDISYSDRHIFSGTLEPFAVVVVFGGGTINLTATNVTFVEATSGRMSLNKNDSVTIKSGYLTIATTTFATSTDGISLNLNEDLTGTSYLNHTTVAGDETKKYSPGKKANGNTY